MGGDEGTGEGLAPFAPLTLVVDSAGNAKAVLAASMGDKNMLDANSSKATPISVIIRIIFFSSFTGRFWTGGGGGGGVSVDASMLMADWEYSRRESLSFSVMSSDEAGWSGLVCFVILEPSPICSR